MEEMFTVPKGTTGLKIQVWDGRDIAKARRLLDEKLFSQISDQRHNNRTDTSKLDVEIQDMMRGKEIYLDSGDVIALSASSNLKSYQDT
jgi:hypothetical protein